MRIEEKPSNIFSTKVSNRYIKIKVPRFCPTAPGSTVFKEPTSIYNPGRSSRIQSLGPGTYAKQLKWNELAPLQRVKTAYDHHRHKDLVVKPNPRAPSIPAKKSMLNGYSGLGNDTVGPACYNSNDFKVRKRLMTADFISSKQPRKVFEPRKTVDNDMPSKENPAPGQYNVIGL